MVHCRNIIVLLMIVSLSGCTTLGSLQRHYNRIDFKDGIDRKEARTIAMKAYLKSDEYRNYRVGSAKVYNDKEILRLNSGRSSFIRSEDLYADNSRELKFPGSWYVVFRPKFLSFFNNYYLVIVNNNDGSILLENDSNLFGDMVKTFFLPRLMGAVAISIYYVDKKEVPESVEILNEYLLQLPDGKEMKGHNLDGLKFEKISPTQLKVFYNAPGATGLTENGSGLDKLFNSVYELEMVTQGDKTVMRISGDYNGAMELGSQSEKAAE